MRAVRVEDLPVFHRAKTFLKAVFEVTASFRHDYWLADQLNDSSESIVSNISEGFRQPTDRAFARYLGIAAASAEEARTHLLAAEMRGQVQQGASLELRRETRELADMLAGFIRYLHRCERKNRYQQ